MKFNRTLAVLGGVIVLVAIIALAYYAGLRAGRGTGDEASAQGPHEVTPGQPQWSTAATYGNWQMRCRDGADLSNKKGCVALLEIIDSKKHQLIMSWLMGLNGKGGITSTIQTPSGVLVARGLDLQLGNSAVRHADYTTCGANGCEASIVMDAAFISDALAAGQAKITIYAANGKAVNLGIPIKGVDKAVATFQ